ncbi:hypothetical protein ACRQ5B_07730 [Pseudarthrobacter sp. L19]|uniref:hypothetical protein n=1 Tax=Pseudarthrobacter sp. L19 TaxID=3423951 RepID=UPI003D78EF45
MLDNLKADAHDRAHVVRYMRPGEDDSLNAFRALIAARIPSESVSNSADQSTNLGQVFARELGSDVRVELTWERKGVDLDLHAELPNNRTVDFRNAQANTETGAIRLEEDIRDAPGPEILHISGEETVAVYVHAYSADGIGTVGAKLRVVCGHLDSTMAIPFLSVNTDSRWCLVLIVDSIKIQVIDENCPPRPVS